jgi:hypothetical protein
MFKKDKTQFIKENTILLLTVTQGITHPVRTPESFQKLAFSKNSWLEQLMMVALSRRSKDSEIVLSIDINNPAQYIQKGR